MAGEIQEGAGKLAKVGVRALIVTVLVLAQAFGTLEDLRLETTAPGHEIWRLVTGHLIHVSWSHLALNLVALLLLWFLFEGAFHATSWVALTCICMVTINIGLIGFSPDVTWYAGLSGILHGLVVAGAIVNWQRFGHLSAALLLGILVKLLIEQYAGVSSGLEQFIGARVIVDSHLYGALGGFCFGSAAVWRRQIGNGARMKGTIVGKDG